MPFLIIFNYLVDTFQHVQFFLLYLLHIYQVKNEKQLLYDFQVKGQGHIKVIIVKSFPSVRYQFDV